ncbi:hypothetical protein IB286_10685 [Spongiibacter sp. KMU-158]|uniref:Lipoprotein n=1 Tax=Spongiibacter pelagi TaxID=2760804 RepID=A0A927C1C6_9GAMM|nr:hypothetical protein [Spongiibacter pelagi]MBD2859470.1 hypothetical protein [Spongiibacter pelagi]
MNFISKIKILASLSVLVLLVGCGTPAQIAEPSVSTYSNLAYQGKTVNYDIFYAQPKPGLFSDGEMLPMVPFDAQEKSPLAEFVTEDIQAFMEEHGPVGLMPTDYEKSDFLLVAKITATKKAGPAWSDFKSGKSFLMSLLTFTFAPSYHDITANYEVEYDLYKHGRQVFSRAYNVNDSVPHEQSDLAHLRHLSEKPKALFRKTLSATLDDFYKSASAYL